MPRGHAEPSCSFSKNNRAIIERREGAGQFPRTRFNSVPGPHAPQAPRPVRAPGSSPCPCFRPRGRARAAGLAPVRGQGGAEGPRWSSRWKSTERLLGEPGDSICSLTHTSYFDFFFYLCGRKLEIIKFFKGLLLKPWLE